MVSQEVHDFYRAHFSQQAVCPAADRTMEVLQLELDHFKKVYTVVDALDEYCIEDYTMSNPLIARLQRLPNQLMITSRYPVEFNRSSFSCMTISAHTDDLLLYVKCRTKEKLHGILSLSPTLMEEIVNTVITKSDGMWVAMRASLEERCCSNGA